MAAPARMLGAQSSVTVLPNILDLSVTLRFVLTKRTVTVLLEMAIVIMSATMLLVPMMVVTTAL